MPDYGFIAKGYQSDILPKLSGILGIRSQQQGLAGQQAEVETAQRNNAQEKALASHDFTQYMDAGGLPDMNKMAQDPVLRQKSGTKFLEVLSHAATARQQMTENKRSFLGLQQDALGAVQQQLGGLRSDPDIQAGGEKAEQKLNDAFIQMHASLGDAVLPVIKAYSPALQKAAKAGKLDGALKSVQMQAATVGGQSAAQTPGYTDTGSELLQINPNAIPGAQPERIAKTISPGEQNQLGTDQLGNPFQVNRSPRGAIVSATGLGGSPGGPATFGVGERGALEGQANQNFQNATFNRAAAAQAPQQLDQINKALELSRSVSTGAGAAKRAAFESGAGTLLGSIIPGWDGSMPDATKLQLLDKFSERIAADASKVLGSNASTDAARESIHRQNANIGYTPKAVQSVLEYAKAQTLAVEAKGNAQEAWLQQQGNGITRQHEFETAFRKAYDPRVFQYAVMSPAEKKAYINGLSKEEGSVIAEKTRALRALGALPSGR